MLAACPPHLHCLRLLLGLHLCLGDGGREGRSGGSDSGAGVCMP